LNPAPILLDRNNVLSFERGTPKDKIRVLGELETLELRRDGACDALRRSALAGDDRSARLLVDA
jgi:hypothetical protein